MFDDLKNKRVVIAGGNGLIGRALVTAFKGIGSRVTNADRYHPYSLGLKPPPNWNRHVDLNSEASVGALLMDEGPFDVWVDATYPGGHIEATQQVIEHLLCLNVVNPSIILFASIYGIRGLDPKIYEGTTVKPPSNEYAVIKAGVIAFTHFLACKYGKDGVRVNCISPGGVYDGQDIHFVTKYEDKTPLGRMAYPEDLIGPVMFLASDTSKYVTGMNLVVDGGITCGL